ncbi:hypothetical protein EDB19DRAFT_1700403, partial [Suillus lakei]
MSHTGRFSVRTLTSRRDTKLTRKTDVVITLVPSPEDGESVMSNGFTPIPWKVRSHYLAWQRQICDTFALFQILSFNANSNTYHLVTIPSEIAVCIVEENENGVLVPKDTGTLQKGSETVLKKMEAENAAFWELVSPPYTEKNAHGSNTDLTAEQTEPTHPTLASVNNNFIIKNEYEDTRLALCLLEDDGERLPIVDLDVLPQNQIFTISGQLCIQAHAMSGQTVGKPRKLTDRAPLLGPMAVIDLPNTAFTLYTKRNGSTVI